MYVLSLSQGKGSRILGVYMGTFLVCLTVCHRLCQGSPGWSRLYHGGKGKPSVVGLSQSLGYDISSYCELPARPCSEQAAPLQLLALCLVAPRTISDQIAYGALEDLKDHDSVGHASASCLSAWQEINNQSTSSRMADIVTRFIAGCRRMPS